MVHAGSDTVRQSGNQIEVLRDQLQAERNRRGFRVLEPGAFVVHVGRGHGGLRQDVIGSATIDARELSQDEGLRQCLVESSEYGVDDKLHGGTGAARSDVKDLGGYCI